MLVEKIEQYLTGSGQEINLELLDTMREAFNFSVSRQLMERREQSNSLRGSNPGPCARKMAYSYLGYEASRDLDARSKITFLTGDLIELIAIGLIRLAGIKVEGTCLDEEGQVEAFFDVKNGLFIPCHGDGIIPIQAFIADEPHLLEVKSTNDASFKRAWKKDVIGDQYLLQHNVYLEAMGLDKGVFFIINKNTGHFHEVLTEKDPDFVQWARTNYDWAAAAEVDNLPPRFADNENYGRLQDKKTGKLKEKLAWGCSYCDHSKHCWPSVVVEFERGRPVYNVALDSDDNDVPSIGKFALTKEQMLDLDF